MLSHQSTGLKVMLSREHSASQGERSEAGPMMVHLTVGIRANVSQHAKLGPQEIITGQSSRDWGEQQRAHPR